MQLNYGPDNLSQSEHDWIIVINTSIEIQVDRNKIKTQSIKAHFQRRFSCFKTEPLANKYIAKF